jgi:PTH1 family peptidyl-tRNA hydrolase
MKLIVGLGNFPEKYSKTRHNVGFMTTDLFLKTNNISFNMENFKGRYYKAEQYIIAQPLTLMNLSGDFVLAITKYFKIDINDLLIVYDDLDTSVGKIRVKKSGSSGGQNGIKDIINKLGTEEIKRIKIGIARPEPGKDIADYVLSAFKSDEKKEITIAIENAAHAIDDFINGVSFEKIMSKYNC